MSHGMAHASAAEQGAAQFEHGGRGSGVKDEARAKTNGCV